MSEKKPVSFFINRVLPVLAILSILILWHIASLTNPVSVPSISRVWERLLLTFTKPIRGLILPLHVLASLRRVSIALVFACSTGIMFGALIGWNRTARALIGSVFTLIRPIPPLAWVPLITIMLGIGEIPKVLIVFIGSFIPVTLNTQAGMERVEKLYIDVAKVCGGNSRQVLWQIAMPSILPNILAGVRTSISSAWMVVVAAEMLGANSGVGFLVSRGMDSADTPLVMVAMITIGMIGALLSFLVEKLERVVCPWMTEK